MTGVKDLGLVVVTGAAGLVGQNLIVELHRRGAAQLVAIDRHAENLAILQRLNPDVKTVCAELAEPGEWEACVAQADHLVVLHARITGKTRGGFDHDNIDATQLVLRAAKIGGVEHIVHVSSSVVNSVSVDDYSETKRAQERLIIESGIPSHILRPTLMFGWFDPKHLGWLARFMARVPVFPVPGDGRYMRQPLYERDFSRCLIACLERGAGDVLAGQQQTAKIFDIVGATRVYYVDLIRMIRKAKRLRTPIVHIPVPAFAALLRLYGLFCKEPPFTADQLEALAAGDEFVGVDTEAVFGVSQTALEDAIVETFADPTYAGIVLAR